MTTFVYPVVTYWVWSSEGWLSAFASGEKLFNTCGLIDYAGSGVVHMTGGVAALIAAFILGPRAGRFGEEAKAMPGHNLAMAALGTLILWFGWYGFNCGSTLALEGVNAAKVAVTTTLSPSAAAVTAMIYSRVVYKRYDLPVTLNSALAGLVGITAGCVVVADAAAIAIGFVSALVYIGSAKLLEKLKIDDPIGAAPVHGFAGIWGCLAAGIAYQETAVFDGYSNRIPESRGAQFGQQVVGVILIIVWVGATSGLLFVSLMGFKPSNRTKFLRVSAEVEEEGLDSSEHGGDFKTHF